MKPIAYVKSPFLFKNGTPRQPTVCQQARGFITIEKSVFNNPEHSLDGLEDFTHVWIVFVFHKNNNLYTKAKVRPPRLNGKRVGLFSTRSPYRPNNIGLTLAKIESISGATLAVSGIDMIDGTPVLDIKPYIPQYDCPATVNVIETDTDKYTGTADAREDVRMKKDTSLDNSVDTKCVEYVDDCNLDKTNERKIYDVNLDCNSADVKVNPKSRFAIGFDTDCPDVGEASIDTHHKSRAELTEEVEICDTKIVLSLQHSHDSESLTKEGSHVDPILKTNSRLNLSPNTAEELNKTSECLNDTDTLDKLNEETSNTVSKAAPWIDKPPIQTLDVCFTSRALQQLENFVKDMEESSPFKLQFMKNSIEAKAAICDILREDPRSTYRRKQCEDSLYYFTVDVIHVTCWFDDDGIAEVVRVKPASLVDQCKHKFQ